MIPGGIASLSCETLPNSMKRTWINKHPDWCKSTRAACTSLGDNNTLHVVMFWFSCHACRALLMQWQVECLQSETWTGFFRTWTSTASGLSSLEISWVIQKTHSCNIQAYHSEYNTHEINQLSLLSEEDMRTDPLVCVVCFRRTVSRLSFWLSLLSTSSQSSWCLSTATSWSPTMTRNTLNDRSLPGAQVYSREPKNKIIWNIYLHRKTLLQSVMQWF